MPANAAEAGFSTNVATDIVQGLSYAQGSTTQGQIDVAFEAIGGDVTAGDIIRFTGTGTAQGVTWTCTAGSTLPSKYRPANCRG